VCRLPPTTIFFEPLWTNFLPGENAGVLDWYTVLTGVMALIALTIHGVNYVAVKTSGELAQRCQAAARKLWPLLLVLTIASCVATIVIRPRVLENYKAHPIGFLIPVIVAVSLAVMFTARRAGNDRRAFIASCAYLASMLGGAAFALYPSLLPSSNPNVEDITIYNAAAGSYSLTYGVIWWSIGMLIAIGYFVMVYRMFRGKVSLQSGEHGY
jgi:cytochrome d ubiquinol oxidase subunit II